ncbi:MAG TPA: alpha/beta hydrolase, partial [Thermoanaerobaculia bacterium]
MLSRSVLALLVAVAVSAAAFAASPPTAPAPTSGFVDVPGGKLYYEVAGSGPPLVILHDGLLPSAAWDEQVRFFARDFTVVRYDRRGYGRSSAPAAPYSNLDDLAALRLALHLAPAVLVGCSDGAKLAVDFALAHPQDVTALVLAGPVVSGLAYSRHFDRRNFANYRPVFAEKDLAKSVDLWVNDPWLTAPENRSARARLSQLLHEHPEPVGPSAFAPTPPERPAASRLGEIHVPTLIVVGAGDIPDVHAHAGVLAAGIAGAERVVLPGAGHLVFLELPERFAETVRRFLRPDRVAAD